MSRKDEVVRKWEEEEIGRRRLGETTMIRDHDLTAKTERYKQVRELLSLASLSLLEYLQSIYPLKISPA